MSPIVKWNFNFELGEQAKWSTEIYWVSSHVCVSVFDPLSLSKSSKSWALHSWLGNVQFTWQKVMQRRSSSDCRWTFSFWLLFTSVCVHSSIYLDQSSYLSWESHKFKKWPTAHEIQQEGCIRTVNCTKGRSTDQKVWVCIFDTDFRDGH